MIRIGKDTSRTPSDVIERAVGFFGPAGVGLEIEDQESCCAHFTGGGGYVYVQAADRERNGSSVTVEGREWETQIKQFLAKI